MIWKILIILNTIWILYQIYLLLQNYFYIRKETTFFYKLLYAYSVYYKIPNSNVSKCILTIKIRNKHKTELKEEYIQFKMNPKIIEQKLRAKYSWVETEKQKIQFIKDYREVHPILVDNLTSQ